MFLHTMKILFSVYLVESSTRKNIGTKLETMLILIFPSFRALSFATLFQEINGIVLQCNYLFVIRLCKSL